MKYKEYKGLDYAGIGTDVLKFWQEKKIFEKTITQREGSPSFTFYEGPPSANGNPGIHHVMARAIKDIFCRYKTQKGFQVHRKGGWDTHGLPVELKVEKELGITKEDIGSKISVDEYNNACRETVMRYKGEWDDLTEKMGYWVDLENPYITFERDYMESIWSLLKKFYDKGLLYKGYSIQPYSPAAGTGLSSHELNQPGCYKDVKDNSIVAQFKIKGTDNSYFLAWTTTPWTLPSNSALAVGKGINYVKINTFNTYTHLPIYVILAKDLVSKYFKDEQLEANLEDYKAGDKLIPAKIVEEKKGSELVDIEYEQLLPYVQPDAPAFRIIIGDFVTTEDGTGIVHIAPTFGADDQRVAQQAGIPAIVIKDEKGNPLPLVDKQGRFVKEVTDYPLHYVKAAYEDEGVVDKNYLPVDVKIIIKLKEENKAFTAAKYEHSYPHCWRTDKPVLYYPLDSWFIKTTAMKDRLVELNKTINWKPESTGTGRFGNWLENLVDWNLSRSRYWGTPLPIWRTEEGNEEICIGSLEELRNEVTKSIEAGFMTEQLPEDFDLHRPYVDNVILCSPKGEKMIRELDLIDVWFDSGAMPYAQLHYPFENEDKFKETYPADFIAEGVDQTRGWFFTLHAISVMLFDQVAFKNVVSNGLVLDKKGAKMSKRFNNAIDPFETIAKYGPDATRWYMIANANPWDNLKFDLNGITEVQRRFFATLQNTYSFFCLYANLDGFTFSEKSISITKRTESDRWVISKLNSLIEEVDGAYNEYEPTKAARAIQNFVSADMSNWYVRLNRKRFWKGEYNADKMAAYQTLYSCLMTIAKLAAPIAPFFMERLYQDLNQVSKLEQHESIHLADFPVANEAEIDANLEERMALAQDISSLVHSLRKRKMIKVRQPLSKILVPVLDKKQETQIKAVEDLILSEVNVKSIEYIDDTAGILVKKIKANFKVLGKQYGPLMKQIASTISQFSQEDIAQLEKDNSFEIQLEGQSIVLTTEDVEISSEDIPGWLVANENNLTVALDITLTDELKQEGISRDIVNRIQNLRKEMNLEIQDKIKVRFEKSDNLINNAIEIHKDYICEETQATDLSMEDSVSNTVAMELDEHQLNVLIEKN